MFGKKLYKEYKNKLGSKLALLFLFFITNILAQKDLSNPPSDIQLIPAGSFVIPMDTIYQSIVPSGQAPFNLKAYGLVNKLLQSGIPVKWAIQSTKNRDDIDFTASAERYAPTYIAAATINFRGGPFIVPDTILPCGQSSSQIINSYANDVVVYRLMGDASVDIRYTITHRPKIAVFINGGNQLIHTKILEAANIHEYELLDAADIGGLSNCYTFASEPHADSSQVSMAVIDGVRNFVMSGGNFLAECHAIDTYENRGFFHTTAGIEVVNTTVSHVYPNADLAFSQMHGPLQENERGSVHNWTLKSGSSWRPYFYRSVANVDDDTVVAVGAHLTDPSEPGGNVYYLGGHDYSKGDNGKPDPIPDLSSLSRINALRMYLNAALVPSGNSNEAWVDVGNSNHTISCDDDATLGCEKTGPTGASFAWLPAAGLSCTDCPNPVASPTVTTTYTVTVTKGCVASDTVRVAVTSAPVAQFSTTTVCQGSASGFTNQSIGTNSWQWNFGDPASGSNNTSTLEHPTHVFSAAASYTVTLIVGSQATCSDTVVQTVVVNPTPVITVNALTICAGNSATLTASGANSYLWSNGATTNSITVSPAATESFTVSTNNGFCSATANSTVTVNPLPIVTISTSNSSAASTSICNGESVTLTATGANSYSWSNGATTNAITVSPTATTSYTVTGSSLGCISSSVGTITVNPLPVVAVNNATICAGSSATLTASGANSYSWSNGATTNAITLSPTSTTSYTVTGNSLGCIASSIGKITVNPLPVVTVNSATICAGSSATLTASGANSYSWSNGATTNAITLSPTSTTSYTVTGNTLGCIASSIGKITVNPLPVVTVNNATICAGSSATLTASGANSYAWSNGAVTNAITLSPTSTTSYTVTGNSLGCIASSIGKITVNPLPVVAVNNATICAGSSATLTASGANSYSWSNGATTNAITLSPTSTTSYTVTGNSLGCIASSIGKITVNPLPVVTVNNATICVGSSATLTASGANSYAWSNGATTNTITLSPTSTTSYTVTGNSLGCIASSIGKITVNPLPLVTVNSATICAGSSATLTASGANSYAWSNGAVTNTITLSPTSTTSYTVTGNSLGCIASSIGKITVNPLPVVTVNSATVCVGESATLTASGANSYSWSNGATTNAITLLPTTTTSYTVTGNSLGCIASSIGKITVNPLPVVAVNNVTICAGSSATLTASGANSYAWSNGAVTNAITLSPTTTTSYTVTGNSLGCIASSIGKITVNPLPIVTVNSATICAGESATLTASGANSYAWSNGATTNTITLSPTSTTSYTVTGNTLGCTASSVGKITVNPLPVVTVNSATICAGSSATLTASGANSYAWSNGAVTNAITLSPTTTTSYTVTGNSLGCIASSIATIKVNPLPVVTVNSATICAGEPATLTASGANSYAWSNGAVTNAITLSPTTTTSYTVTGNSLGCIASSIGKITVNPLPLVTVNSATICVGNSATLTASGANSYAWSNGAVTNAITLSPTSTTSYTVTGNTLGCIASSIATIKVNPLPIVNVNAPTICVGSSATLTASGANSYAWSNGAVTNAITLSPTSTTSYTVTGNSLGCISSGIATIKVNPLPIVTVNSATICAGEQATLTASGANSYVWSNGAVTNAITVSPTTTTSYTVTGNSLGCIASSIGKITVNPLPVVTVNSATICVGESATLTASGANSYVWSNGAVTNAITLSPTSTTSYTVTGNSLGCIASNIATIKVNPLPIVTVNSATICAGEQATLTASGANAYAWSNGAVTNAITLSPTTTTSYTVTGNSLGCISSSITTIKVNPLPVVTVNSATICAGEPATLTASGANAYAWSNGAVTNAITLSPTTTTSYTVTGNTLGCIASSIATIKVNPLPIVNVNAPTICVGSSVTLTASGANSYAWSNGAVTNAITVSPTTTTSYTVTGNSLGCIASSIATITVNPLPVVTVNSATICVGEPATLTASGANSYAWSNGAVTNAITLSPATTTSYTVTGNSLGCIASSVGKITVNPLPVITVNSATICAGSSATLAASGANSYAWSNGAVTNAITLSPTSTTSYTVTGNTLGCIASSIATIKVNPLPIVTVNSVSVCKGEEAILTASGANSYSWSNGATSNSISINPTSNILFSVSGNSLGCLGTANGSVTILSAPIVTVEEDTTCSGDVAVLTAFGASEFIWSTGSTSNPITVTPTTTTTYTVTGKGCPNMATGTVTVKPKPVVTVNSMTICEGNSVTLTANGADSYSWSNGDFTDSIIVSPLVSGSYTVTGSSLGCEEIAVANVTVNPLPVVRVNSATICAGSSATIIASGANTYSWSNGVNADSNTVSPTTTTTYSVIGNSLGCLGASSATITVNPIPVVKVNSETICAGESVTLIASGADTYSWLTPNRASGSSITVQPDTAVTYTVIGSSLGCVQESQASVVVYTNPSAEFDPNPLSASVFNPVITFNDRSSSDVVYWSWDFGDGNTIAPDIQNPVHTYPAEAGRYLVNLVVHNGHCYSTISHEIIISPEYSFYIPNAFTPNGDNINDGFRGEGIGIIKYNLSIFDRWGNFIWESDDLEEKWDGIGNREADMDTFYISKQNSNTVKDTYVWKVKLTDVFNKEHEYIGIVTLVK